jgi:diaminopimelate decarboxylase
MQLNKQQLQGLPTPAYVYDTALLAATLDAIKAAVRDDANYHVHYAIKANDHPAILKQIAAAGLGADCVSGGEISAAIEAGFPAQKIGFAGVGKADWEIELAIKAGIGFFNVESREELEVISQIATALQTEARVCLRINPDVSANTHAHITTGREEDKFGIARQHMVEVIRLAQQLPYLSFVGLHFHIGSQLLDMTDYEALCARVNELQDLLEAEGITVPNINVGGGLGIDYADPDLHPIADFQNYIDTFRSHLRLRDGQQLHFEPGRAVVAQMGILLTRVLFVKHTETKDFVILDAGMTDLIRPALYGALHKIENISAEGSEVKTYDIVGPICESSDIFARDYQLPITKRGDLIAIRSAGAYGQTMASTYNHRSLPKTFLV